MSRTLAWLAGVLLACGVVVVVVRTVTDDTSVATAPGGRDTGGAVVVLPPGQAKVDGAATSVTFAAEDVGTIPTPFTIDAPQRGAGSATITGALVDGKRTSIAWDGGRPLVFAAGPGLQPGPVTFDATPASQRFHVDAAARGFSTGTYRIDTAVAVGAEGLAKPQESVTFAADEETVLVTRGGSVLAAAVRELHLEGPGTFTAAGRFSVRTAAGERSASVLRFGPGSFDVTLREGAFQGTLQGPLQSS